MQTSTQIRCLFDGAQALPETCVSSLEALIRHVLFLRQGSSSPQFHAMRRGRGWLRRPLAFVPEVRRLHAEQAQWQLGE